MFTDVTPGAYVLTETVPAGFSQTQPASDGIPVTLAAGGSSINNVFGNFHGILTGTISGVKFNDANGNGVPDTGEGGLPGVTITLSGTGLTRTTVTGTDGASLSAAFRSERTRCPRRSRRVSSRPPAGARDVAATVDFGHQAVSVLPSETARSARFPA
jgi:hypothetical protein